MFGIFKKDKTIEDSWKVYQTTYNEKPMLLRVNEALIPIMGKSNMTLKVGFAIPLNKPNPDGMPDSEENKSIGKIEDIINEIMSKEGACIQALVITMGTFKELVFYAEPKFNIKKVHKKIENKVKSHVVQCYGEIEPQWETYRGLTNG